MLAALAPLAQDAVIAGLNRDYIAVLIVPDLRACAEVLGRREQANDAVELVKQPHLRQALVAALEAHNSAHPGNSTRVARAIVLTEPLSLDRGEITDKGSVNQRVVLECRDSLVRELYQPAAPATVLIIGANSGG